MEELIKHLHKDNQELEVQSSWRVNSRVNSESPAVKLNR